MMESMDFRHELSYAASPEQVHAMLTDARFREEVCASQQVLRFAVSVEDTAGVLTVEVDQVQEARGIPAFATKFVGDEIAIEQRETWSSPSGADLEVTIPGKPMRMRGAISLAADADGHTVERVRGEISVSIPLIGGKLAGFVGDIFRLALDAEHAVGRSWLADA